MTIVDQTPREYRTRPAFRVGIVTEQDLVGGRVTVQFSDRDQMASGWLHVISRRTAQDKDWWIPDLGEQVVCLMDERDEAGAVLGSIWSTVDAPPASMTIDKPEYHFSDGATFSYDRKAHSLAIALPSGATATLTANGATFQIDASGNINLAPGGEVVIAGGGAAIARVGDTVHVTDPDDGVLTGTIVSGSSKAVCG